MTYQNRHECKFLLSEDVACRLLQRVNPFVLPDPHAAKSPTHSYSIASLYLDDEAGNLYRETEGGLPFRYKLRIRSYSDDAATPVFLEVKRRYDRVVQKLRCPIQRSWLPKLLLEGQDEVPDLSASKQASLREFLRLVRLRRAVPRVTVRYERQAYVGRDDDQLRVTFDRRLAALVEAAPIVCMHADHYESVPQHGVVLELKFTDRCPQGMLNAVRVFELRRQSCSKYCTSIDALADLPAAKPALVVAIYHLLLAFVLSKPLAWVYVWTHHGMSYSSSFVQALVLLAMIVTIVMLAIGDSLARAFGLFGALALIRFRTPIKDSRDTVFLFQSVAIGIMVGVQNTMLAVVGTTATLAVASYLYGVRFGERMSHDAVLRFSMPAEAEQEQGLRRIMRHYCRTFALVTVRDSRREGAMDFAYQLQLHDQAATTGLVADVRSIVGAADVQLLLQNEHEEI